MRLYLSLQDSLGFAAASTLSRINIEMGWFAASIVALVMVGVPMVLVIGAVLIRFLNGTIACFAPRCSLLLFVSRNEPSTRYGWEP